MKNVTDYTQSNRAAWDASAASHEGGERWQRLLAGFAQPGFSTLDSTATSALQRAGIEGGRVVQVGCNLGSEVLSCHALGAAACWGIDISPEFLRLAERLNQQAGRPAHFIFHHKVETTGFKPVSFSRAILAAVGAGQRRQCTVFGVGSEAGGLSVLCDSREPTYFSRWLFSEADVYALPSHVPRDFDIALITIGVVNWMPDLPAFFRALGGLLVAGGRLVMYETHPFLEMFEPTGATPFAPTRSYFRAQPDVLGEAHIYDGSAAAAAPPSYWFAYTLGEVVTASVQAGFALRELREHPHCNREAEYRQYEHQNAQMPLCFTLLADWPGDKEVRHPK
ncbi:class I SAM-dependent methyltransferase [Ottowia testudinis]|uniref:Class I SAM-dependent methyltransferase n=1 Tax=Ottowia testudinis TaxID=2816950 RepID=A0A975CJ24_9BURK|nr:class I SAM-dependent methyltransferase [Ottowia testudinis]QTD47095.1 class I SAM-dependent methyltransferase [Ottowia testudinis]